MQLLSLRLLPCHEQDNRGEYLCSSHDQWSKPQLAILTGKEDDIEDKAKPKTPIATDRKAKPLHQRFPTGRHIGIKDKANFNVRCFVCRTLICFSFNPLYR